MSGLPGVSIVIVNYNYAQFVAFAIESALAQDHPRVEVIVVDDCSTDQSREVIERYADRVRTVFLPNNRGQVAALNAGWPLARHEILMFLDADDVLQPYAASTISRNWTSAVAKIQFQMQSVDADGRNLNQIAPKYPAAIRTATLQRQLIREGSCYATGGSGNAYAKWFLERISPIVGLQWMDLLLMINAPFHGEVRTLRLPLASYRVHDSQFCSYNRLTRERFVRFMEIEEDKFAYLSQFLAGRGLAFNVGAARMQSLWYLQCLTAISRLSGPGDRWHVPPLKVVGLACRGLFRSPYSVKRRAALLVWITVVALAPRRWVERLLELRFSISSRKRWFERILFFVAS